MDEKRKLVDCEPTGSHALDVGDGIVTPGAVPVGYQQHLLKVIELTARS